jgi:hypothetical protein
MKCRIAALTFAIFLAAIVCLGAPSPLAGLEVFNDGHPRHVYYRGDPERRAGQWPYAQYLDTFSDLDGIFCKALSENIARSTNNPIYLNQLVADRPTKMVLNHFLFYQRNLSFNDAQSTNRFSPGHWLFLAGAPIAEDIAPTDSSIRVEMRSRFKTNDDIVIVRTDAVGHQLWEQAEFATITEITNGRLGLVRGRSGTVPLAFTNGFAYAAPRAADEDGGWRYNFATTCPRDSHGRNASDVYLAEFAEWFAPNGVLSNFHGVDFDVSNWESKGSFNKRKPDTDLDGEEDDGFVYGTNVWSLGIYDFFQRLRGVMGDDRIILCDDDVRVMQWASGIDHEGFTGPDDPYRLLWSTGMNDAQFWEQAVSRPGKLYFVAHKLPTLANLPTNGNMLPNLSRIVIATVTGLGAVSDGAEDTFFADQMDEYHKGQENQLNWLGQFAGPLRRLGLEMPDLLAGAGVNVSSNFVARWTSTNATFASTNGALEISAVPGASSNLVVNLTGVDIPATANGDLLFAFDGRADPLPPFTPDVPRRIKVTVLGRNAYTNSADALETYAWTSNYFRAVFYFRHAGPVTNAQIQLDIEGSGKVWIKNFTLHNAADALARQFEHGLILANPARDSFTFHLTNLFPGFSYRRFIGSANQDPVVNNGQPVTGPVTLGDLDGLFLVETGEPPPVLRLDWRTTGAQQMELRWASQTNEVYSVQQTTNLVPIWNVIATNLSATPPTNVFIVTTTNGSSFYRALRN